MSKSNNIPALSPEGLRALRDLKRKKELGETLDPDSNRVLGAISIANRILNTINNGGQIDPAFLKGMMFELEKEMNKPKENKVKIIKKKKFKNKNKL